jgi:serine/threonine protein kinase
MFQFNGYVDIEKLREETGIVVYKAVRKSDNTPVIIKMPNSEDQEPLIIAGFKHEYEISQRINSENIVKIYGIEPINNTFALIEEDFGGIPLQEVINLKKPDLREFLALYINIAESLKDIHQCNIIHNNINPGSIFINPETNTVKITGFGIAAVVSNESRSTEYIQRVAGTLQYISPEQTGRMNRPIDFRSDFYSLGVNYYLGACLLKLKMNWN